MKRWLHLFQVGHAPLATKKKMGKERNNKSNEKLVSVN